MLFYDATYIPWLIYTMVPFFVFLIITTTATEKDVNFKDIGPEHGNGPFYFKLLTYAAAVPMTGVLILMIGSGFYHKIMSL